MPQDDLPSLDTLQRQINKAHGDAPAPGEPSTSAQGIRFATEMVAGVLVGGFLGYWADEWLGTSPWLIIVFIFLGLAGGLRNVFRASGTLDNGHDSSTTPHDSTK